MRRGCTMLRMRSLSHRTFSIAAIVLLSGVLPGRAAAGADCDRDGVEDAAAIASGAVPDCDGNGVPDSCDLATHLSFLDAPPGIFGPVGPSALQEADMDGDGDLDLVAADWEAYSILVISNDGEGRLSADASYRADFLPLDLVAADLDGDGLLDVAVVEDFGRVLVFPGTGGGVLGDPAAYPVGRMPVDIAAADLDGDGLLDLVTADRDAAGLSILPGQREGGFGTAIPIPTAADPLSVVVDDLDRDGIPDLIAGHRWMGIIKTCRGLGALAFETPVTAAQAPSEVDTIKTADTDADGRPDLLASIPSTGEIVEYRSNPDGTWQSPRKHPAAPGAGNFRLFDLDGDSVLDIACAGGRGVTVLRGTGGGFSPLSDIPSYTAAFATGDFDGDLRPDIVIATYGGITTLHPGRGDGTFPAAPRRKVEGAPVFLLPADLDADGSPDLVLTDEENDRLSILLGRDGDFAEGPAIEIPAPAQIAAGDIDGDGDIDLFVTGWLSIATLLGNGDGTFLPPIPTEFPYQSGPSAPAALVDLDGDGRLDAAGPRGNPDRIAVLLGAGDGTFREGASYPYTTDLGGVAAGDLDGDSIPDLVFGRDHFTSILLGWGDGAFHPAEDIDWGARYGPTSILPIDVDRDGHRDLAYAAGSGVGFLLGRGDGTFVQGGTRQVYCFYLQVADMDGDDRLDLMTAWGGEVCGFLLLRGDGAGGIGGESIYSLAGYPGMVVSADFDRDGTADAAALVSPRSPGPREIVFFSNRTVPPAALDRNRNAIPDPCDIAGGTSRDADGDGVPDEVEADCDGNGIPDNVDILAGAADADGNGVPDACEPDCNANGLPDPLDIARAASRDADRNRVPDECQPDCDGDALPDPYAVRVGLAPDLDGNGVPDGCDVDCDKNGVPDVIDLQVHSSFDRNGNGVPDTCDCAAGTSRDIDGNGVPDEYQADCDGNGIPDTHQIATGASADANRNLVPDACDIAAGTSRDSDSDGIPDEVEADCDADGVPDDAEIAAGSEAECDGNGILDRCDLARPPIRFRTPGRIAAGGRPQQVIGADFDGNGLSDIAAIVTRHESGNGIEVFRSRVGGLPGPMPLLATDRSPACFVAADLDRDGALDIAVAGGNKVEMLFGNGDGTFRAAAPQPFTGVMRSLIAGDIDGDGPPDLVASDPVNSRVSIAYGKGDGTLEDPRTTAVETPTSSAFADLDGDGRADIAAASTSVNVLLQTARREFAPAVEFPVGGRPYAIAAADIDRDGDVDLAATLPDGSVEILVGAGDGTFPEGRTVSVGSSNSHLAAEDLDGDGTIDLATGGGYEAAVARGLPGGGFGPAEKYVMTTDLSGMATSDVDGDGRMDLIASFWSEGAIDILFQEAGGSFRGSTGIFAERSRPCAADFDGDGRPDVALARGDGAVSAFLLREGLVVEPAGATAPTGRWATAMSGGDLDRDGDIDLVLTMNQEFLVLRGAGDGTFPQSTRVEIEDTLGVMLQSLAVADLSGDGIPDAMAGANFGLVVLVGNGDGTFRAPTKSTSTPVGDLAVADFNGDGRLDVASVETNLVPYDGHVRLGNGRGGFTSVGKLTIGGEDPTGLAAADLDGDGKVDLAAVSGESNDLRVMIGRGNGQFLAPARIPIEGGSPSGLVAADLDLDGDVDLATWRFAPGACRLLVLGGDGKGKFTRAAEVPASLLQWYPYDPIATDLDGDGRTDFLLPTENALQFVINETDGPRAADCDGNGAPDACDLASGTARDCNANGAPDSCDIASKASGDVDADGVPDECEPDCDGDEVPDDGAIASGAAKDCNGNATPDSCDIASGRSRDEDADGIPDECKINAFLRGDTSGDGTVDITDGICILLSLFAKGGCPGGAGGGGAGDCLEAADANDDGRIDCSDPIGILEWLFLGGNAPAAPGPRACGPDPAGSPGDLGCETYAPCAGAR
jgi:hypothetical protein